MVKWLLRILVLIIIALGAVLLVKDDQISRLLARNQSCFWNPSFNPGHGGYLLCPQVFARILAIAWFCEKAFAESAFW